MASEIFVGSVSVGVVPDARGWNSDLRRQLIPSADAVGNEYGKKLSGGIVNEMGRHRPEMAREGERSGGAFADTFRKRIDAAIKNLPKAEIDADSSQAERRVQYIRLKLEELSKKKIGVDIDPKDALKELAIINKELDYVQKKAKNIDVRFDTTYARAQLMLLKNEADSAGKRSGMGVMSGMLNGIVSGVGGTAPAGGGIVSGITSSPAAMAVAGALGLFALPFIGQAVGGALAAALGGALTGIGIAGAVGVGGTSSADVAAAQQKAGQARQQEVVAQQRLNQLRGSGKATTAQMAAAETSLAAAHSRTSAAQKAASEAQKDRLTTGQEAVRQSFKDLADDAKSSLTSIGESFVPVMQNIARLASGVITTMTPVFKASVAVIAGPFQLFMDTVLKAFTRPEVQKSIYAISQAFADILTAFTPDIPGIFDSFAGAIERLAGAISNNPKAFADFLNFLFQLGIFAINALAFLTNLATYMENTFAKNIKGMAHAWGELRHGIAVQFDLMRHDIAHAWDLIWNNTIGRLMRGVAHSQAIVVAWEHNIAHWFDVARHEVAHIWDLMWNNTVGRAQRGYRDVVNIFHRIRDGAVTWWHNVQAASANIWNTIWDNTIGRAIRAYQSLVNLFKRIRDGAVQWWHNTQAATAQIWNTIWSNTVGRAIRGVQDLMVVVGGIKGKVVGALRPAGNWLVDTGRNIVTGMYHGIQSAMAGVGGWLKKNLVDPIINNVKHFFGIKSPSTVMAGIGGFLAKGLFLGMIPGIKGIGNLIKMVFGGFPQALGGAIKKGLVGLAGLPSKAIDALMGLFGGGGSAAKLASTAHKYDGHRYVWGGPANATAGFDCSSFVNMLGGMLGLPEPGGFQAPSSSHGPVTTDWLPFGRMQHVQPADMKINDLYVSNTHMGIVTGPGMGFAARSTATGTGPQPVGSGYNILRFPGATGIGKLPGWLSGIAGKVGSFLGNLFGGGRGPAGGEPMGGAGVQRWAPLVAQALSMEGLPQSLAQRVLYQMQTESGGNPRSINNWDVNAARGDPSRGLMQVTMSTFLANHVAGTSFDIYDRLANIAAAIAYAAHTYGPTLMRGSMGMGSGHGYDEGGVWPHGTFGWNMSGSDELVLTNEQARALGRSQASSGVDGGVTYVAHFDGLTGEAIESHVRTAFSAMALTQGSLSRQGRRS